MEWIHISNRFHVWGTSKSIIVSDIFDGFGNILNVFCSQTSYGDSAVLGHVNVMLGDHGFTLLDCQSCEREHTNLVRNMVPSSTSANSFKSWSQKLSHLSYAIGDSHKFIKPLLSQVGLVQYHCSDSCAMPWWRWVVDSDEDLDLREHFGSSCLILAYKMKSAGSFSIKSHNFGEWLSNNHLETLVYEVSEGSTVFVEVSSDESLVSCIKEWIKLILLAHCCNLLPLLHSWVNSSWIVSACM